MRDEAELLRRYALEHDNAAFSELVRRSIDFVYAAALRQCRGNTALAQDVTQLVFTDLSRRAKSLVSHPELTGWLHTAARYGAMKILRAESRRQLREQQAAAFHAALGDEDSPDDWTRLQPVLDDAIGELRERDRTAILLRFFKGMSLIEVGASLHLSETAARSCVARALERLRERLARRGITSTSAALGLTLVQQAAAAAPTGLASAVTGAALANGAISGAALVPAFVMKKILLTTACLALVAELATATVELKARRSLEAETRHLDSAARIQPVAAPLISASAANPAAVSAVARSVSSGDAAELDRLEKRLTQLKARPPGVIATQMRSPHPVGRDTPENAIQTLTAALRDRDMSTLDRFVFFNDDTPENREVFMANFSDAVRARYQTPERLMIAFSFDQVLHDSPVAQQVLATHGYSGGARTVTAWTRLESGVERQDTVPFEMTPNGWALTPLSLVDKNQAAVELMRARIDPVTGDVRPLTK